MIKSVVVAYILKMESEYKQMLEEQGRIAMSAKDKLMSIDPALKNQPISNPDNDPKYFIAKEVQLYYNQAIFFQDEESLNKLEQLKLVKIASEFESISQWFITLDDLHNQYNIIRGNHISIDYLSAYAYIKMYLCTKFAREISRVYTFTKRDKVFMPQLSKDLINLKKRKEYSGADPIHYKNFYEVLLNVSVNKFAQIPIEECDSKLKFDIDTFLEWSKGKTESFFLKKLVDECFSYNHKRISKTKFLAIVYDLLKLLMPHRRLRDHDEYTEASLLTYKSYDSYKAHELKKILYPKYKPKRLSSVLGSL